MFGIFPVLYLRRKSQSDTNALLKKQETGDILTKVFSESNRRALLACVLIPCLSVATYYIVFVWMVIYMATILDPPVPHAFAINTILSFLSFGFVLLGGMFADWYGNYTSILLTSCLALGLLSPLLIFVIARSRDPFIAFACQSILGVFLCLWNGAMLPFLCSSFPPQVRLTSLAVGHSISNCICGGFSPALATYLVGKYDAYSPGFIVTILACVSLLGLYISPSPKNNVVVGLPPDDSWKCVEKGQISEYNLM